MRSEKEALRGVCRDTGADRPRLHCIHLETLTQVHQLLRRLIRGGGRYTADLASLDSFELDSEVAEYCVVDASIDSETRCASVFQVRPAQRLLFGGVYPALSLETTAGTAYLELLRPGGLPAAPGGDALGIGSSLATLLVRDGATLRSAVLDDITHLSAEQNYVRLHLSTDESVLVRGPLQKYAAVLPAHFLRISRRLILNVTQVGRVKRVTRDLCLVSFLSGEQSVRLGRRASLLLRHAMADRSVFVT
jgi:DNA-binding LytR/AlgR family response regulator